MYGQWSVRCDCFECVDLDYIAKRNERRLWACVRAQENAMTASWFSSCSSHVNTYQYSSWVNIFGRIIETVAENNQPRNGNSEAGGGAQGIIDKQKSYQPSNSINNEQIDE